MSGRLDGRTVPRLRTRVSCHGYTVRNSVGFHSGHEFWRAPMSTVQSLAVRRFSPGGAIHILQSAN